jgi:putative ABC transport system permease protein
MNSMLRDLRYGIRGLIKSPGLTIVALLALTLGIGLTTTMFSIVYGALMKGLPYPDGDRVVILQRSNPVRGIQNTALPIQDYLDFRKAQHSSTDLAAVTSGTIFVSGDEKAERFDGSWITSNTFDLIGVRPFLGRNFRAGEDSPQGEKVAIIAYSTWKERYAGDANIIGKQIRVNGVPTVIVGVMPEAFAFPNNDKIWVPQQTDPLATPRDQGPFLQVIGKLKPGVSMDAANVDMATIAKRLASEYPQTNEGFTTTVQPFVDSYLGKEPKQLLYTMLGAVFFVLLIACANVANLLLDRAAHRTKEVGIRTALGASRAAVVRQFLAEALALSLAATGLGIIVAHFGIDLFNRAIADQAGSIPFFIDIRLHPQVLAFTIAVAALTTLVSGAIPAIQSSRADINEILKDDSRGASSFRIGRMSRALVVFEIALSCGLLVAAGLMIKSVAKMRDMNPGFVGKNVLAARVGFPVAYTDTIAQWQFFDQVLERVSALPGVQSAAISAGLPASRQGFGGRSFEIEGQTYLKDKDHPITRNTTVSPSFFSTLTIPVLQGRSFTSEDRVGSLPVAVVNKAFVDKFNKNGDVIGRRIRLGGLTSKEPWRTVVGVVGNVFTGDQENPMAPTLFTPFAQARVNFVWITAKTTGPPLNLSQGLRETVASVNPDIPLYWVQTVDDAAAQALWFIRVFGTMFMIFGFVALFLASVGLYAVMSFSVSRRTREVGIRMALGARGRDVIGMIFTQGAWQLGIGMAAGLALALVGLFACLIPARRATLVDPLVALRSD